METKLTSIVPHSTFEHEPAERPTSETAFSMIQRRFIVHVPCSLWLWQGTVSPGLILCDLISVQRQRQVAVANHSKSAASFIFCAPVGATQPFIHKPFQLECIHGILTPRARMGVIPDKRHVIHCTPIRESTGGKARGVSTL